MSASVRRYLLRWPVITMKLPESLLQLLLATEFRGGADDPPPV